MDNSISMGLGAGFMAVFAVSGSFVLLAHKLHKRLLSDFIEKIESELGSHKNESKKKVRFADDVVGKEHHRKNRLSKAVAANSGRTSIHSQTGDLKLVETMPLNRQALYKGIIEYKAFKRPGILHLS